jgi:hypothetical protein
MMAVRFPTALIFSAVVLYNILTQTSGASKPIMVSWYCKTVSTGFTSSLGLSEDTSEAITGLNAHSYPLTGFVSAVRCRYHDGRSINSNLEF